MESKRSMRVRMDMMGVKHFMCVFLCALTVLGIAAVSVA
jgi:hypothetical protein